MKKTTVWELVPNQYEYKMFLCLSEEPLNELIQKFNKNYNIQFDDEIPERYNEKNDCTLYADKTNTIIIVLRHYNKEARDYSTLAHELFHAITIIAEDLEIEIDYSNTTECWAYFMSFYMDVCITCLNEHIEKKKPQAKT